MKYDNAKAYVESLNHDGFAGHSDWRLPTVDELKSLLTQEKQSNDMYINTIFDKTQQWCWTSDKYSFGGAWLIVFNGGIVYWHNLYDDYSARAVRSLQ